MEMSGIQMTPQTLASVNASVALPSATTASATARPASSEQHSATSRADVVQVDAAATEEAERLSYDQPDGRQGRAVYAYQSVSMQPRREALQQMLKVDLYA
ncbi:MAG: hypothetical protein ACRCXB_14895 [Aeromonadaceae bacterium]